MGDASLRGCGCGVRNVDSASWQRNFPGTANDPTTSTPALQCSSYPSGGEGRRREEEFEGNDPVGFSQTKVLHPLIHRRKRVHVGKTVEKYGGKTAVRTTF